jgi:hypothetical protein
MRETEPRWISERRSKKKKKEVKCKRENEIKKKIKKKRKGNYRHFTLPHIFPQPGETVLPNVSPKRF